MKVNFQSSISRNFTANQQECKLTNSETLELQKYSAKLDKDAMGTGLIYGVAAGGLSTLFGRFVMKKPANKLLEFAVGVSSAIAVGTYFVLGILNTNKKIEKYNEVAKDNNQ